MYLKLNTLCYVVSAVGTCITVRLIVGFTMASLRNDLYLKVNTLCYVVSLENAEI